MAPTQSGPTRKGPAGFALARPLAAERIRVPASVKLHKDRLVWKMFDGERKPRWSYPDSGLIWKFVELADQEVSRKKIAAFARSWGVLGVCEHGYPNFHPQYEESEGRRTLVFCHGPKEMPLLSGEEPVLDWRKIAGRLRTVLVLARDVAAGRLGDPEDWERAGVPYASIQNWRQLIEPRRARLAVLLNGQLILANSRLELRWAEATPEVRIGGRGLYAALVAQLLLEVSSSEGLLVCDDPNCRRVFRGTRAPEGRRNFCGLCRRGTRGAWRAASKHYRALKRRARELDLQGMHTATIAKELDRKEKTILKWLQSDR